MEVGQPVELRQSESSTRQEVLYVGDDEDQLWRNMYSTSDLSDIIFEALLAEAGKAIMVLRKMLKM